MSTDGRTDGLTYGRTDRPTQNYSPLRLRSGDNKSNNVIFSPIIQLLILYVYTKYEVSSFNSLIVMTDKWINKGKFKSKEPDSLSHYTSSTCYQAPRF